MIYVTNFRLRTLGCIDKFDLSFVRNLGIFRTHAGIASVHPNEHSSLGNPRVEYPGNINDKR